MARRMRLIRKFALAITATVVAIAALAVVAVQGRDLLPRWLTPFDEQVRDRSGPAVLRSVRDLSRYEAASGTYQVIVDLERDAPFLPDGVRGERTLFIGVGSVDAYVDFSRLGAGAITVNPDRTAVEVRLSPARLEPTSLDPKHSYVFARERGLTDRVEEFFGDNSGDQQKLYVLAADKIQKSATASGLLQRADRNAELMMKGMLGSLGFQRVTITRVGRA
jgi:hypothetical protein